MVKIHTLGFPRMGAQRELKFALEQHWSGASDGGALERTAAELRARHWQVQRAQGLDFVTVGDFALYDHVANHIQLLGCEPARFGFDANQPELARYFALARGAANGQPALEMTKWFDTNYHYLVPEFTPDTPFGVSSTRLFAEVDEALAAGHPVKAVLLGPLSFLWLGRARHAGWERLALLDALLPVYCEILQRLRSQGVAWVQLDEPILGLDLPAEWRSAFERSYWHLAQSKLSILLACYFSPLQENLRMACQLPVAGLHVDAVRAPQELGGVADWLPAHKVLSVGLVDGRNVWRTEFDSALRLLAPVLDKHPGELWLAPSCSLLHVPYSLEGESALDPEIQAWLAFAVEKLAELRTLRDLMGKPHAAAQDALTRNRAAHAARRASRRVHDSAVAARLAQGGDQDHRRSAPYARRQMVQRQHLQLPLLPTTTIGSFPQTAAIRAARAAQRRGHISAQHYQDSMQAEIALAVRKQEALGLDVLVHGEAERNDMVEYFAEQLEGFAITTQGWVQSYGSRCVKPPLIYGDVSRASPMTVRWACYAQSLTQRPVKGMLTGPVTLLQWSFVRDDQPRSQTLEQIAWAIRDEVADLERAGIRIIQIDEPALREGLPLRRAVSTPYLDSATRAFRISASGVGERTQIHTHMCYCDFGDILPEIASLDADVITLETSRSDMALLQHFGEFKYPNEIGPGVYDVHAPGVPSEQAMTQLLRKALAVLPAQRLWVNPDCGLKTRNWSEVEAALTRMVATARALRAELLADASAGSDAQALHSCPAPL